MSIVRCLLVSLWQIWFDTSCQAIWRLILDLRRSQPSSLGKDMAVTSRFRHTWENGVLIAHKTGRMWASLEEHKLKMVIARRFRGPSH